jgi:hypothetical protein
MFASLIESISRLPSIRIYNPKQIHTANVFSGLQILRDEIDSTQSPDCVELLKENESVFVYNN